MKKAAFHSREEGVLSIVEKNLGKVLQGRAKKVIESRQGLRTHETEEIFAKRWYISPEDLSIENYPRRNPLAAFNPAALLDEDRILIFPRLIFDYYPYTSSVGVIELPIETLLSGNVEKPLKTRIVLWSQYLWEVSQGCEDPRVFVPESGKIWLLYTGVGKQDGSEERKSVLGFAELGDDFKLHRKGFFSCVTKEGVVILSNKDSAFIQVQDDRATMLTRPAIHNIPDMCWRTEADLEELLIPEESLQPVFPPEDWEYKVGWSTNTVQLSKNEYLVGWHAVLREDLSYRDGLAIVDSTGELKAISNYLLAPQGLSEEYGDRPLVIFGNGLLRCKEYLIWIGGVSDYCIGIFVTRLDAALGKLKRV